jgi:two-component system response regulator HydG
MEASSQQLGQVSASGDGKHLFISSLAEIEKRAILDTIQQLQGDKLQAAKILGIGKTTLYRKLKQYGFEESVGMSRSC